jgi:hypothetical protein
MPCWIAESKRSNWGEVKGVVPQAPPGLRSGRKSRRIHEIRTIKALGATALFLRRNPRCDRRAVGRGGYQTLLNPSHPFAPGIFGRAMDSNAWTTISRKGTKGRNEQLKTTNAGRMLAGPDKDMTVDKIRNNYAAALKRWQGSGCRKQVLRILDKVREHNEGWHIDKAICLASGSFSQVNQTNNRRALQQFAAFADICRQIQGEKLQIYGQEPLYTAIDKRFLTEVLGVQVLDHPLRAPGLGPAGGAIDSNAFIFEPFMEYNRQNFARLYAAQPALYIGSPFRDQPAGLRNADAQYWMLTRADSHWPDFEEDSTIFEGIKIFWERPIDDEEKEEVRLRVQSALSYATLGGTCDLS